jgi:uncharacterized membrane-anchored protein
MHGNDPRLNPIIYRAVTQLDFRHAQLSVKLRSATELLNDTANVHVDVCHVGARDSMR